MIKKLKVKKQLRLDQLIKHIFDNNIRNERYRDNEDVNIVVSDSSGYIYFINRVCSTDMIDRKKVFEIEVEEKITEDTIFDYLIEIDDEGCYYDHGLNIGISDVKDKASVRFYAGINGKLELIWERGNNG